jgi:RTX calcium-binding nonapeptide repeat (4 copies)
MARPARILALALLFGLTVVGLPQAQASTFSNPATVAIPDRGSANPYPSTIGVTGLPGTVADVNVTLNGLFHTCFSDVWFVVVGPGGQKSLLMSHAGSSCGNDPPGPVTITFDDEATTPYPCDAAPSGTFKPVADACVFNEDVDLPAPAPTGPYPAVLSAQDGGSPNGNWNLFVYDQYTGDQGPINGGWSLDLLPTVSCAGRPATISALVGTAGNDVLVGTPGPDVMIGLGGNDAIHGLGGKDVICGGAGDDRLFGGPGKDLLRGEAGRDRLNGQGGKDSCVGGPKPDKPSSCEKQKSI